MFEEGVITEFKPTGACEVDVEALKQQWHKGARIYKYVGLHDTIYRLVEWKPESDSEDPLIKVQISEKNALELIKSLNLEPMRAIPFYNSFIFAWW